MKERYKKAIREWNLHVCPFEGAEEIHDDASFISVWEMNMRRVKIMYDESQNCATEIVQQARAWKDGHA